MKFLPNWDGSEHSGIFAENFFLDNSVTELRKIWGEAFTNIGKVIKVDEIKASNQLSGGFIVEGTKGNLEINIDLAPDATGKIQSVSKS